MTAVAFAVAVLALFVALASLRGAKSHSEALGDVRSDARRCDDLLREELEGEITKLREMLALFVAGEPVTADMVREGRTWRDVLPTEAAEILAAGGLRVLDVRTPRETDGGILPGALLVPIDELESRAREIPKDGVPTLVYCAGGGRSAAACEFLASEGRTGLMNLQGGIQSWSGPVVKPS